MPVSPRDYTGLGALDHHLGKFRGWLGSMPGHPGYHEAGGTMTGAELWGVEPGSWQEMLLEGVTDPTVLMGLGTATAAAVVGGRGAARAAASYADEGAEALAKARRARDLFRQEDELGSALDMYRGQVGESLAPVRAPLQEQEAAAKILQSLPGESMARLATYPEESIQVEKVADLLYSRSLGGDTALEDAQLVLDNLQNYFGVERRGIGPAGLKTGLPGGSSDEALHLLVQDKVRGRIAGNDTTPFAREGGVELKASDIPTQEELLQAVREMDRRSANPGGEFGGQAINPNAGVTFVQTNPRTGRVWPHLGDVGGVTDIGRLQQGEAFDIVSKADARQIILLKVQNPELKNHEIAEILSEGSLSEVVGAKNVGKILEQNRAVLNRLNKAEHIGYLKANPDLDEALKSPMVFDYDPDVMDYVESDDVQAVIDRHRVGQPEVPAHRQVGADIVPKTPSEIQSESIEARGVVEILDDVKPLRGEGSWGWAGGDLDKRTYVWVEAKQGEKGATSVEVDGKKVWRKRVLSTESKLKRAGSPQGSLLKQMSKLLWGTTEKGGSGTPVPNLEQMEAFQRKVRKTGSTLAESHSGRPETWALTPNIPESATEATIIDADKFKVPDPEGGPDITKYTQDRMLADWHSPRPPFEGISGSDLSTITAEDAAKLGVPQGTLQKHFSFDESVMKPILFDANREIDHFDINQLEDFLASFNDAPAFLQDGPVGKYIKKLDGDKPNWKAAIYNDEGKPVNPEAILTETVKGWEFETQGERQVAFERIQRLRKSVDELREKATKRLEGLRSAGETERKGVKTATMPWGSGMKDPGPTGDRLSDTLRGIAAKADKERHGDTGYLAHLDEVETRALSSFMELESPGTLQAAIDEARNEIKIHPGLESAYPAWARHSMGTGQVVEVTLTGGASQQMANAKRFIAARASVPGASEHMGSIPDQLRHSVRFMNDEQIKELMVTADEVGSEEGVRRFLQEQLDQPHRDVVRFSDPERPDAVAKIGFSEDKGRLFVEKAEVFDPVLSKTEIHYVGREGERITGGQISPLDMTPEMVAEQAAREARVKPRTPEGLEGPDPITVAAGQILKQASDGKKTQIVFSSDVDQRVIKKVSQLLPGSEIRETNVGARSDSSVMSIPEGLKKHYPGIDKVANARSHWKNLSMTAEEGFNRPTHDNVKAIGSNAFSALIDQVFENLAKGNERLGNLDPSITGGLLGNKYKPGSVGRTVGAAGDPLIRIIAQHSAQPEDVVEGLQSLVMYGIGGRLEQKSKAAETLGAAVAKLREVQKLPDQHPGRAEIYALQEKVQEAEKALEGVSIKPLFGDIGSREVAIPLPHELGAEATPRSQFFDPLPPRKKRETAGSERMQGDIVPLSPSGREIPAVPNRAMAEFLRTAGEEPAEQAFKRQFIKEAKTVDGGVEILRRMGAPIDELGPGAIRYENMEGLAEMAWRWQPLIESPSGTGRYVKEMQIGRKHRRGTGTIGKHVPGGMHHFGPEQRELVLPRSGQGGIPGLQEQAEDYISAEAQARAAVDDLVALSEDPQAYRRQQGMPEEEIVADATRGKLRKVPKDEHEAYLEMYDFEDEPSLFDTYEYRDDIDEAPEQSVSDHIKGVMEETLYGEIPGVREASARFGGVRSEEGINAINRVIEEGVRDNLIQEIRAIEESGLGEAEMAEAIEAAKDRAKITLTEDMTGSDATQIAIAQKDVAEDTVRSLREGMKYTGAESVEDYIYGLGLEGEIDPSRFIGGPAHGKRGSGVAPGMSNTPYRQAVVRGGMTRDPGAEHARKVRGWVEDFSSLRTDKFGREIEPEAVVRSTRRNKKGELYQKGRRGKPIEHDPDMTQVVREIRERGLLSPEETMIELGLSRAEEVEDAVSEMREQFLAYSPQDQMKLISQVITGRAVELTGDKLGNGRLLEYMNRRVKTAKEGAAFTDKEWLAIDAIAKTIAGQDTQIPSVVIDGFKPGAAKKAAIENLGLLLAAGVIGYQAQNYEVAA